MPGSTNLLLVALFAATPHARAKAHADIRAVRITAVVPDGAPAVYLTGNRPELGPWNPAGLKMEGVGTRRVVELAVPRGTRLEFKFTLGSWETEALDARGAVPPNRSVLVDGDKDLTYTLTRFKRAATDRAPQAPAGGRPAAEGSGVLGTLRYHHDVGSKHLKFPRHVAVWLPPGYEREAGRRYPVLYMHDGQNLFDPRLAFTGVDWGMDEAVVRLVEAGKIPPIIVVGVFNSPSRIVEYNPLAGGEGYGRFLVEELKPTIDAAYRTLPGPRHTGVMGSSAGGLISLGLGWEHPEVFTRIGALSAHLPPIPRDLGGTGESFLDRIEASGPPDRSLKIYVDRSGKGIDAAYGPHHERLRDLLVGWGWREGENLKVAVFEDAAHTEADWRKRIDVPLEFLFGDLKEAR